MKRIYLDHNATSPVLPRAREEAMDELAEPAGHPDALHRGGIAARSRLNRARERIAQALSAHPSEIVFTSGGSEGNATALHAMTSGSSPARIIVGATEHPSVLDALDRLVQAGRAEALRLPVDANGRMDAQSLANAARGAQGLALMAANNETGVLTDLESTARIVAEFSLHWHCDAVQLCGRAPMTLSAGPLSAASTLAMSGHKLGALPGTGVLFVRDQTALAPLIGGSDQEGGRRGGTPNMPGALSLAAAFDAAQAMDSRLRDRLEAGIRARFPHATVHGEGAERLPQTLSIALASDTGAWLDAEELQLALAERWIAVATGAACTSGSGDPSHVLLAMGCSAEIANATLRFSLGPETTEACVDAVVKALDEIV